MTITIKIPTGLRRFVDHQSSMQVNATTLNQAIATLADNFPAFRQKAYSTDGQLRQFVRVFVNAQAVNLHVEPAFLLKDGDQITLMTAIAGG